MHEGYGILGMPGVGFFGMLLIGAIAGWLAERAMNRDHGLLTNVLVGIAGSFVGGTLAGPISATRHRLDHAAGLAPLDIPALCGGRFRAGGQGHPVPAQWWRAE